MRKKKINLKTTLREQKKHRRKIYHKIWKRQQRIKKQGISQKKISYLAQIENSTKFIPPKNFSLRENTEPVLRFISDLKRYKNIKMDIFINLSRVENITNGSIAMLLSVIRELSSKGIIIRGRKPRNKVAKKTIEKSGFFNHVKAYIDEENTTSADTIITQGTDSVDQESSAQIVLESMQTILGTETRNQPIQGMLIELMANSVNHAFPDSSKQKKWVLSVNHDVEKKKVSFAFVDNGFGIIKTLNLNFQKTVLNLFKSNNDLLKTAFEGQIGSRTKLNYRGRGLPSIFNKYQQNYFKEFVVITNNVFIDFQNNDSRVLDNEFHGTFYYWELNQECKYHGNRT